MKWKYTYLVGDIVDYNRKLLGDFSRISLLWSNKNKNDEGKTVNNEIQELGQNGWELIAVTPISTRNGHDLNGITTQIMFTFKKPIEDELDVK